MPWDAVSGVVAIGALLVSAIGLYYVFRQVKLATTQLEHVQQATEAETTRARRQATIDYFMSTVDHRATLQASLPRAGDAAAVRTYIEGAVGPQGQERRQALGDYLSFYEAMAVAVASNVYDLTVLDAMDGGMIRSLAVNYKPYFDAVRTTPESSSWFVELEWLGRRISELRGSENRYVLLAERESRASGCPPT